MPSHFQRIAYIAWRLTKATTLLLLSSTALLLLSPILIPIVLLLGLFVVFFCGIFVLFFIFSMRHTPLASQAIPGSPRRIRRRELQPLSPIDWHSLKRLQEQRAEADRLAGLDRVPHDDWEIDLRSDGGPSFAKPWEDDEAMYMARIPPSGGHILPTTDSSPQDTSPSRRRTFSLASESGSSTPQYHGSFIMTPEEVEEHRRRRASSASLSGFRSPPGMRTPAAMSSRGRHQYFDFGWDGTPPRRDSRHNSISTHRRANLSTTSLSSVPESGRDAGDQTNNGLDRSA